MIRPAYSLQSNNLQIVDKSGNSSPLNYRPNIWGSAGGQLKLGGVVLSYMYRLPVSNENSKNLGETDYQNIGINIQTRYVGLNFDYIDYRGFYLANVDDTPVLPITDGARTQIPELNYYSIGFKTTVAFKKDFSINAGFAQTERMKKSAGSFMFRIGDRYTQIKSDTSIIPASHYAYHRKFSEPGFNKITYNTTYVALGAGYSFVKGYFSFTPIVLVGAGIQLLGYEDNRPVGIDNMHLRHPLYFAYKNAISYNHDNFFMRVVWSAEMDRSQIKPKGVYKINSPEEIRYNESDNTTLSMFYLNGEVSFGIRFGEKKTKAEKKAKKATKK
ncbi:MAG: DUF4421 family protein [Flavobacteriales bacterium]|nr:DUF4421 family protein [Flavobacteriales bacterium]